MTTRRHVDPRRLATAEMCLLALDALPPPDQRAVYTGWVAWRLSLRPGGYDQSVLLRALNRLARLGLADKSRATWDTAPNAPCYWRRTPAGHRFDGTAADLARPIRCQP
jgi:hypothetical protein